MAPLSIILSLLQLVDPVEARARKLAIQRKLQEDHDDEDGDDPPQPIFDPAPPVTARAPVPLACRVCDFRAPEGRPDAFCPHCLAETLIPARP